MKTSFLSLLLVLTIAIAGLAQHPAVTAEDYTRATKMLGFNTDQLVDRNGVRPTWLPDGRFYYRVLTATGSEYVLVDPSNGSRKAAAIFSGASVAGVAQGSGEHLGRVPQRCALRLVHLRHDGPGGTCAAYHAG